MKYWFRFRRKAAKTLRKWMRSRPAMVVSTLLQRRSWKYLVIHNRRYTTLPEPIVLPLLCGNAKGKLSCPAHLTIVLIHNYEKESILEKSLRYVGIENYVLLRVNGQWPSQAVKLIEMKKYIDSGDCPTEYILYIDSDDAVLRGDPGKAVQYLQEEECDLLFSYTYDRKHFNLMEKYLPETRRWADQLARDHGCEQVYLNAGVFIGKTTFLKEILNIAVEFVTEHDISPAERNKLHRQGTLAEALPEFPKGAGSDQMIFRYLHPRFYPKVKIDFKRRLAFR